MQNKIRVVSSLKTLKEKISGCCGSVIPFLFILMMLILSGSGCHRDSNTAGLSAEIISPGMDIEIKEGESVFFKGRAIGGFPPYVYSWNFGVVAPNVSQPYTPGIIYNHEGAYTAIFTVVDGKDNTTSDRLKIIVTPKDALE